MDKLSLFLTRHPKSILMSIVILMLASVWPASKIRTDFSLEGFFPKEAQTIVEYQRFINDYGRDDNIIAIPYFRNMYVNRLNEQIVFYVGISSVLIILLLWFLYRNWRDVLIPIGIVWVTILFTVAILQLTGGFFEIMSSTIAPILLCVGIADSIHVMSKYNDELIHGADPDTSIRRSLVTMGTATLLTSITTAIGFATLATSNVLPMRNFGLYTAAGVMIAFVVTIIALPPILKLSGERGRVNTSKERIHRRLGAMLHRLDDFVHAHHRKIVLGGFAVTVTVASGIAQLRVNSYIFDDVGRESDLLDAANFASTNLTPQFPLEIIVSTGEEGGIYNPELVARVDSMHQFLVSVPEFRKVISFASLMEQTHRLVDPAAADTLRLPDTSDRVAQYQLLLELTGAEAATGFTDFDYSEVRLSVLTEDMGSYRMGQLRDTLDMAIARFFPDEKVMMTGSNILVSDLTHNIVSSLTWSILLAIAFIGLLMWALFRRASLIVISMIPNLLPLLITAGIMGYLQIWIKPSTAVIFTIAFGIAVDDTIHYLARLRLEAAKGLGYRETVRLTTEKTGRAMILTSVILLTGFGTLGFSDFDSTRLMGNLVSLTIFTALFADLIFLPALIYWIKPDLGLREPDAVAQAGEQYAPTPVREFAASEDLHPA